MSSATSTKEHVHSYMPAYMVSRVCKLMSYVLSGNLFEEILPKKVLDSRDLPNGGKEYLVQWLDGSDDSWVGTQPQAKLLSHRKTPLITISES